MAMTALRELVGLWDDRIKKAIADADATGSNAIKRIYRAQQYFTEDCRNELSAALSAQAERVCGTCRFYVEQTHKTPFGRSKITDCAKGHLFQPTPEDFCSKFTKKEGLR